MNISARNQLKGKITDIAKGMVNCEVVISIGDINIKSVITNDAVKSMGLNTGDEVIALIKASHVIVSKEKLNKISARNILKTTVQDVVEGQVNCELKLSNGKNVITSTITKEACKELEIAKDDTIYALFKASSVIVVKE